MAEKLWLLVAVFELPENGEWRLFLQDVAIEVRSLAASLRAVHQDAQAEILDTIARSLVKSWAEKPSGRFLLDTGRLDGYLAGMKPLTKPQTDTGSTYFAQLAPTPPSTVKSLSNASR